MKDSADENLDRLFAIARSVKLRTETVENCFETRLMARLRERKNRGFSWLVMTWRLMPIFISLAVVLGVINIVFEPDRSQDIFTAITASQEEYEVVGYLGGE